MVVIRLSRSGQKSTPIYKVMVQDKDAPQSGRFIEQLGTLRLTTTKGDKKIAERYVLDVKADRYAHWVKLGAQPSPRLKKWAKEFKVLLADVAAETAPAAKAAAPKAAAKAPAKSAAKSKK